MKRKQVALLLTAATVVTNTVSVDAASLIPKEEVIAASEAFSEVGESNETDKNTELETDASKEDKDEEQENIRDPQEDADISGDSLQEQSKHETSANMTSDEENKEKANEEEIQTVEQNNSVGRTVAEIGTTFTIDKITYEVTSNTETLEVAAVKGSMFLTEIVIPSEVTYEDVKYQVTSIPNDGFDGNFKTERLVLPEGLRTVGKNAFRHARALKEVVLPSTLETFTYFGFPALEKIILAESNPYFELVDGVLFTEDKTVLHLYPSGSPAENYEIPEGTKILADSAFYMNQNLKSLTMPDSLTTVNNYALDHMNGLENIVFGRNVSYFGSYQLYGCEKLQTVTLRGNGMLGNYFLNDCPKLERITIDGEINGYGMYSLYDLPSLKEYVVTEENRYYSTIEGVLFNGLDLLRYPSAKIDKTYVVPESTAEISALAFNYMQNTTEVILPPNVKLASQAFNYPNRNSPIDIYFRDTEEVHLGKLVTFVALLDGSNIYLPNETVKESFLSYDQPIESEEGMTVNVAVKKIPVKKISFDVTEKELKAHQSFTLTPVIEPDYYSEEVTWGTSDSSVATVENGVVQAVGYGKCEISLTSASGVKAVCKVSVVQKDIDTLSTPIVEDQPYTGEQITPSITLKDGTYTLQEGKDYTLSYGTNIESGNGTITITGKGDYKGTKEVVFRITPKDFRSAVIQNIPDQMYTGKKITPEIVVQDGNDILKKDVDYTISYENHKNVGTATVLVKGKGNYAGSQTVTFRILEKDIADVSIAKLEEMEYTGNPLTPEVIVKDGDVTLKKDTDYTVSYKNNVHAGTAVAIVEGIGNYNGSKQVTFEIKAKDLKEIFVQEPEVQEYAGTALTPEVVVKDGEVVLQEGKDYAISYKNNVNAGTAIVVVQGKGNYTGKKEVTFHIKEKDIQKTIVSDVDDQIFDGEAFTPEVVIKDGDIVLQEGKDYSVSYKDNVNVGTATIVIEGKGNYTGRKMLTFRIGAEHIKNVTVSQVEDCDYNGKEQKPGVVVTDDAITLVEGQDYKLTYFDNTNAGIAKAIVTGIGNYVGEAEVTFTIRPKEMDPVTLSELSEETYNGTALTPEVTVTDGEVVLKKDVDYTVKYSDNVNAGTAQVIVEGKGNYKGTKRTSFIIQAKAIDEVKILDVADCVYNGKEWKPDVVVKDGSTILKQSTEYRVTYENNVNAGSGTIMITGTGNYKGEKEISFTILAKNMQEVSDIQVDDQIYTGEALTPEVVVKDGKKVLEKDTDYSVEYLNNTEVGEATAVVSGIGNYTGTKSVMFHIGKDLEDVSVGKIENQTYTGKALTPDVILKDKDIFLKKDVDYTVSYKNNINVGTATIVVSGLGDYVGSLTFNFEITAKSMEDVKISPIEAQKYTGEAVTPELEVLDGDYKLVLNKDYTVSFEDNTEVGTATAKVTGIGNYEGELTATFEIKEVVVVPPADDEDVDTDDSSKGESNTTTEEGVAKGETGEAPKTADVAHPLGYSVLLGLSGIASILGIRRRKGDSEE